jgi:hypothetical protein
VGLIIWKKASGPKSGDAKNAVTTGTTGAGTTGGAQGYGSPGGQPLMSSTGMPFTPTGTADGFAPQQGYGSSPYTQPLTPSNGTDYNQPPVSQYTPNAYGASVPPISSPAPAPWAGGQPYGGAFGGPDAHPNYAPGSPPLSNTGGSAYGGATAESMHPYGGYESRASPGPQVQTWVERTGPN